MRREQLMFLGSWVLIVIVAIVRTTSSSKKDDSDGVLSW